MLAGCAAVAAASPSVGATVSGAVSAVSTAAAAADNARSDETCARSKSAAACAFKDVRGSESNCEQDSHTMERSIIIKKITCGSAGRRSLRRRNARRCGKTRCDLVGADKRIACWAMAFGLGYCESPQSKPLQTLGRTCAFKDVRGGESNCEQDSHKT